MRTNESVFWWDKQGYHTNTTTENLVTPTYRNSNIYSPVRMAVMGDSYGVRQATVSFRVVRGDGKLAEDAPRWHARTIKIRDKFRVQLHANRTCLSDYYQATGLLIPRWWLARRPRHRSW